MPAARRPRDADIPDEVVQAFLVPACVCGGVLEPDVVFFGDNVPKDRVDLAFAKLEAKAGELLPSLVEQLSRV